MSKSASIPGPNGADVKGRVVMNLFPLCLFLINLQETPTTAFDDLGKLLAGGTAAAIVLAVGFTLVRLRMRDKKQQTSNFISISSVENERSAKS